MKFTNFIGPAYLDRSVNVNASRTVNCYPEVDQNSKHVLALYGTPGLSTMATVGAGPIRGMFAGETHLYVVSGSTVHYVDTSWNVSTIGTISTSTGPVSMDQNTTQLTVVDGTYGYAATLPTPSSVSTVTSYPASPSRVTVLDGYAIANSVSTGKFYLSGINDVTTWDPLDFATAEGMPDDIVAVLADHRELWLFGVKTTEVWANTGNSDFPFERISGAFIEQGCVAAHSVSKMDNGVFWLSGSDRGDAVVYRATGYQPSRISTHAIEYAISNYATISDAIGWTYEEEGHAFYVLTFPTGNATWVYDVAASAAAGQPMWHQRAYMNQGTSTLGRHRANCHAFFNRVHVVGDFENGKIYKQNLDLYSDAGDLIKMLRAAPTKLDNRVYEVSMTDPVKRVLTGANLEITKGNDRNFHHRLQVTMETGVGLVSGQGSDPQVMMRYSNDNGHTWSNELWGGAGLYTGGGGNLGEYQRRVIYRRLGSVKAED